MLNSLLASEMTLVSLMVCLVSAMALGVLNALVFSYGNKHSASFSLTLALLPVVVSVVIMMVNGNIGTGVAVAGAFALVRFRSVPGTAREIAAIFTSMAIGLIIGMGYVGIAVIFFVLVALFTLILTAVHFGEKSEIRRELRITIPENLDYEDLFDDIFEKYTKYCHLEKVHTTNMGTLFELTYEVEFEGDSIPKAFVDEIRTRNGNLNVLIGRLSDTETL